MRDHGDFTASQVAAAGQRDIDKHGEAEKMSPDFKAHLDKVARLMAKGFETSIRIEDSHSPEAQQSLRDIYFDKDSLQRRGWPIIEYVDVYDETGGVEEGGGNSNFGKKIAGKTDIYVKFVELP